MQLIEKESWHLGDMSKLMRSMITGEVLADMADQDDRIVVLTADLAYSNRTIDFAKRHPDKFFNFGIAEQNMVSAAAGIATLGNIPYVTTFASFLALLCCEQIRTDLAYPNLPVRLIGHHSGISLGYYGTSHHATEEIGLMRSIANMKIVCPADSLSLKQALQQTVDVPGPIYFRLSRGRDPEVYQSDSSWTFGKVSKLRKGTDAVLIANGTLVSPALKAAEMLNKEGIDLTVADLHTIVPLDVEGILSLIDGKTDLFVAEEHNIYGGVASVLADMIVDQGIGPLRVHRIGLPSDEYAVIAQPYHLYSHYKLDSKGIADRIRTELNK